MARFIDVVSVLASADPAAIIYAVPPFAPESDATISTVDDEDHSQAGFAYLLDVTLARDVLDVWSNWRGGRHPTSEEAVKAVIYYAKRDAYEPAS
jgi:hypothetical protein